MDILLRQQFGLPPNPWSGRTIQTTDMGRAGMLISAAITAQAMVWILGDRGCGKTHALRRSLAGTEVLLCEPLRLDRERLHLGDIQSAIVRDLSEETLRRSGEARSGQVRRILGKLPRPPVLVIDEAHCLHKATIKGLKRLRELRYRGRSPLIGIVLVGQFEVSGVPEVSMRSDRATMAGLTSTEASEAIEAAMNADRERFESSAIKHLSGSDLARNWLNLAELCDECLAEAFRRGSDTVDAAIAADVLRPIQESDPLPAKAPRKSDEEIMREMRRKRAAA